MTEIDRLRDLVGKYEIEEVIRMLKLYSVSVNTRTEIFMQESRWNSLQMELRRGTGDRSEHSREKNEIAYSLLQITNQLDTRESYKSKQNKTSEGVGKTTSKTSTAKPSPLFGSGQKYYKYAMSQIDTDKREASIKLEDASQCYREALKATPNYPEIYLSLARALKTHYLLNYGKGVVRIEDIDSCIKQGRSLDMDNIFYAGFNRVLDDIYQYHKLKYKANAYFKWTGIAFALLLLLIASGSDRYGTQFLLMLAMLILPCIGWSYKASLSKYYPNE